MALNNNDIAKVARLARLAVSDEETEQLKDELENILKLIEKMQAIDTNQVDPMTHPLDATLRMRQDAITETCQQDTFQAIAPDAEKGLYRVPKVID